MFIKNTFIVMLSCLFGFVSTASAEQPSSQRVVRAAVDIGSGATKLRVAEIDLENQKIVRVLETQSFTISYQEQLARSSDGQFDQQIMEQGIQALKQAKEIAAKYGAEKVIAVATAAFRKATNVDKYIENIFRETGIKVEVIDQKLEGELAFQAVRAQYGIKPTQLVVWDIGGGSLQLTTVNEQNEFEIYRGHEASIPFKNHTIEKIKLENPLTVSTPNPLNAEQLLQAQFRAIDVAQEVDTIFKDKIMKPDTEIVGVGNIFGYQLTKMAGGNTITKNQLTQYVAKLIDKNDQDVGGGDFANVYVTNSILILGFMQQLHIDKVHLADINPADGAFFYSLFW